MSRCVLESEIHLIKVGESGAKRYFKTVDLEQNRFIILKHFEPELIFIKFWPGPGPKNKSSGSNAVLSANKKKLG